jgi:hypothetical protein
MEVLQDKFGGSMRLINGSDNHLIIRVRHRDKYDYRLQYLIEDDENIIAYKRTFKKTCIVLVNFSNKEVEYDDTIVKNAKLLVSSKKDWIPGKLRANEAVVLEM